MTALDTNVLVSLLAGTVGETQAAESALTEATLRGPLVICGPVYAELMAMPGMNEAELDDFLANTDITVDWVFEPELWRRAGAAYGAYAARRRRQQGDAGPRRILADFLIGAHAEKTDGLLTTDPKLYRSGFKALTLFVP